MNPLLIDLLTVACALGAATAAGTFFTFSTFTMAGLRRLPAAQGVAAMQAINKEAVTPPFMVLLFGTAAAHLTLMTLTVLHWQHPTSIYRLLAGGLYLFGVVVVTGAYHVPRNERLRRFAPGSDEGNIYWRTYLAEWVPMNHLRTLAPLASALLLVVSLMAN